MRAIPEDEVERPVSPRRQEMERRLAVIEMRAKSLAQRHGRLAAGLALTALAAFGVGMMVYRARAEELCRAPGAERDPRLGLGHAGRAHRPAQEAAAARSE